MITALLGAGGVLAALSTGAVLHRLSRPVRTGQTGELRLERVAADVYRWRGYFSNAAALVLPGQILVIDTLVSPELAMRHRLDDKPPNASLRPWLRHATEPEPSSTGASVSLGPCPLCIASQMPEKRGTNPNTDTSATSAQLWA